MDPLTLGVAAVGIGSSLFGGKAQKKAAKKAAKEQGKLVGIQRAEERRQRVAAAGQQVGLARATAYTNNVLESGSTANYISALDMENTREIAYADYAAQQEQRAIKKGAQGAGNSLFIQAAGQVANLGIGLAQNYTPSAPTPSVNQNTNPAMTPRTSAPATQPYPPGVNP
jgi:hypothetical protein